MSEHDQVRELLGAHVLGGLASDDRARVAAHLPGCAPCRDELAATAGLPGLLRRGGEAAEDGPGGDGVPLPPLLARLVARRRRDRRRRRMATAGAGALAVGLFAAVALAGGVGGGFGGGAGTPDAPAVARTAALTDATDGPVVSGRVQLQNRAWGTALRVEVDGLGAGGPFTLVVTGPDRATQRAATWGATPDGPVVVQGACSWRPEQVRTVQVLDRTGTVLARG